MYLIVFPGKFTNNMCKYNNTCFKYKYIVVSKHLSFTDLIIFFQKNLTPLAAT